MLLIFGWLALLSACSSYSVHCNKHLRAINVPDRTASAAKPLPSGSAASQAPSAASGKP